MRSGSATDDPPNFCTIRATAGQATGRSPRPSDRLCPCPRPEGRWISATMPASPGGKERHVRRVRRAVGPIAIVLAAALTVPLVGAGTATATPVDLVVRGSVHQVDVLHAPPGA